MAYTILRSNGSVLTTIADGTINTSASPLGLPGFNYSGYGQVNDTNIVRMLENFANASPPTNALKGQLFYCTNNNTLYICPSDGETNIALWASVTTTSGANTTTFGSVTVTGNLTANNAAITGYCNAASGNFSNLAVSVNTTLGNLTVLGNTSLTGPLTTNNITTGSSTTAGNITGIWSVTGNAAGNALVIAQGNLSVNNAGNVYGIKCDNYMFANGAPLTFAGSYGNSNVAAYLPNYAGNITANILTANWLSTGANTTPGNITGNWTLTTGSRMMATYADLAERFHADDEYAPGTVVELGGANEITAVREELSENIFGVISNTAGYLMNAGAGDDKTHPPVAQVGRVKVNVSGMVKKHDRLVSAGNGAARAAKLGEATPFNTIGRALEDKASTDVSQIEASVIIR